MRKQIPNSRVSEIWQREHPRTKQPPIKAYVTTRQELNKVTNDSLKGRRFMEQNTRGEYGKHNAVSPETHNVRGLIMSGRTNVILVERGTKRNTTHILKHELNHVFEQRKK
jgi:sucrose-6-phosphate hydrolase SacC (GH32 family)